MISVGLTGWGDHDALYPDSSSKQNKLKTYSQHFPIVEVDSSFYAIQAAQNYERWVQNTPPSFSFIVKAYQGMTGHTRRKSAYDDPEMFASFKQSIQPLINANKLKAVLFQYPPWFDCKRESVKALRYAKDMMDNIPVALEFRNQSWFSAPMRDRTLRFMEEEGWIHSICDEPQAGSGSVPIVLEPTNPELTIVRFHGRNVEGWRGHQGENWRDVRYLYQYNEQELWEWKERLEILQEHCKEICVLFNNNSGGHAAGNAKELMKLLGQEYEVKIDKQLDFFSLDGEVLE